MFLKVRVRNLVQGNRLPWPLTVPRLEWTCHQDQLCVSLPPPEMEPSLLVIVTDKTMVVRWGVCMGAGGGVSVKTSGGFLQW